MRKESTANKSIRSRSIYSKLLIRFLVCGYLFGLSILQCIQIPLQDEINHTVVTVANIIFVILCIYSIIIPLEPEDEMVHKLYAKANSASDIITQVGLMLMICLLNVKNYYSHFTISTEVLTAIVSGLLLLVATIRVLFIFYYSKKGM